MKKSKQILTPEILRYMHENLVLQIRITVSEAGLKNVLITQREITFRD